MALQHTRSGAAKRCRFVWSIVKATSCTIGALLIAVGGLLGMVARGADAADRSVLPLPNTVRPDLVVYDAKSPDATFPPIPQVRPPEDAPNVLIVLLDDVGFGATSAFGGPCQTPTLERLAQDGLLSLIHI